MVDLIIIKERNDMKSSLILITMIGLTILVALNVIDSAAMSACQEKHSYDTCFQLLNR